MASNERIRKYLDAGTVLGQVSRGRAEEIVRELVNAGDIQRSQAQEWVDNLVERSHKSSEQVLELVRHAPTRSYAVAEEHAHPGGREAAHLASGSIPAGA